MPFQRRLFAPRRAQNLLAGCIFDGLACQKCFCVTLDKSNRTEDEQVCEIGGVYNAKNDKRNGALLLTKVTKPENVEIYRWEMKKCRER